MSMQFSASQSVEFAVPEQPIPIQYYLRQPQRLIQALVDPSRLDALGSECFRLKMRPLEFLILSFQPTVDLRVWHGEDGSVHLQSIGCEIRGVEYINQRFSLNLVGQLSPIQVGGATYLKGKADLTVQVDIPAPLYFTPQPILETAGNGLLKSVLLTVKQRLMHQLLVDYRQWVADSQASTSVFSIPAPSLSTPRSAIEKLA
jgi:hypothetical protein